MSDVTVAPTSAPPAETPQTQSNPSEVAIDTNPVQAPTPVGSQAPDKPHPTRREAIQAAFDRAVTPQRDKPKTEPRPAPKAAEAKPGHNNPPEETEKLDLKKRPADQPRGDRGQFAPRIKSEPETTGRDFIQPQAAQPAQAAPQTHQLPANAPYRDPPARASERARAEWHATPESVRGDIHRMQGEFVKAYNYYKGAHEAFKPVQRFHDLAIKHGTTLEKALTNFVGIEELLRKDPIAGLDAIVNNLSLVDPQTGQKIGFRDISYHVLTQTPDQLRAVQQGNQQTAASQQIGALHQEVKGLKNSLQQMHNQQVFAYTRQGIDQFAATHPRTDELADLIKREIDLGFDLETAYRRADLLRPSTHAAQTRTTSAQTRTSTDRSISGAPTGPTNGAAHRNGKPVGRREAIQNAINRVGGL